MYLPDVKWRRNIYYLGYLPIQCDTWVLGPQSPTGNLKMYLMFPGSMPQIQHNSSPCLKEMVGQTPT